MRFILAVSDNNILAVGDKLPWKIKHDFQWFKMNTMGCPVVMGRKTWDSIGKKPLPNRENIVVSRKRVPGVRHFVSMDKLKQYLHDHPQAWVIGGAQIYTQLWNEGDTVVLTRVHMQVPHGLNIQLPPMKELWSHKFDGYTFSINIVTK